MKNTSFIVLFVSLSYVVFTVIGCASNQNCISGKGNVNIIIQKNSSNTLDVRKETIVKSETRT